jgi:hypothetical protein
VVAGSASSGSAASLAADDGAYFSVTSGSLVAPSWYASFTGVPAEAAALRVTYAGRGSRTCTLGLSIFDWQAAAWTALQQVTIGTNEVMLADLVPPGAASRYRSPGGEVRVRVVCSASTSSSYSSSGDLLTLTYDA